MPKKSQNHGDGNFIKILENSLQTSTEYSQSNRLSDIDEIYKAAVQEYSKGLPAKVNANMNISPYANQKPIKYHQSNSASKASDNTEINNSSTFGLADSNYHLV